MFFLSDNQISKKNISQAKFVNENQNNQHISSTYLYKKNSDQYDNQFLNDEQSISYTDRSIDQIKRNLKSYQINRKLFDYKQVQYLSRQDSYKSTKQSQSLQHKNEENFYSYFEQNAQSYSKEQKNKNQKDTKMFPIKKNLLKNASRSPGSGKLPSIYNYQKSEQKLQNILSKAPLSNRSIKCYSLINDDEDYIIQDQPMHLKAQSCTNSETHQNFNSFTMNCSNSSQVGKKLDLITQQLDKRENGYKKHIQKNQNVKKNINNQIWSTKSRKLNEIFKKQTQVLYEDYGIRNYQSDILMKEIEQKNQKKQQEINQKQKQQKIQQVQEKRKNFKSFSNSQHINNSRKLFSLQKSELNQKQSLNLKQQPKPSFLNINTDNVNSFKNDINSKLIQDQEIQQKISQQQFIHKKAEEDYDNDDNLKFFQKNQYNKKVKKSKFQSNFGNKEDEKKSDLQESEKKSKVTNIIQQNNVYKQFYSPDQKQRLAVFDDKQLKLNMRGFNKSVENSQQNLKKIENNQFANTNLKAKQSIINLTQQFQGRKDFKIEIDNKHDKLDKLKQQNNPVDNNQTQKPQILEKIQEDDFQ
ncbi:hypothetical protein PPERSA_02739 [Pseudocohnilembus persalinus]|uniref:Uncharacterized protein n=1 Tax=Pseudocohnilembus persalinus TaxID=266149 RepID=A0A0V0R768_PSEPJ|nr:hypothetical protein PPERSA_02739 [Pseudocohnilembus persalinus]|eukprot:KRX10322.1 hypothetical protein PPERSA_02739 [Pseudocohnilembus persalinus]